MKSLYISLEDAEHARLKKQKGDLTWKEALIKGCGEQA